MKRAAVVMTATALLIGAMTPAFAQDAVGTAESDVVITGRPGLNAAAEGGALGDRSILDTPFSITVIDAADIETRQPASIQQVFVNDPSVFSFAAAGTVNWWGAQIRGLGVRSYYIDDAPLDLYWGGDYPLEAVESVQALKGATGFMYGFGAPGGLISYRSKRPTDTGMLATGVEFRGRSALTGTLDAGGPVDDAGKLGYRLNLAAEQGEEYNAAEITRGLASLAGVYEIAPNLTWRANVLYEDFDLGAEPFHIYWSSYADANLPRVPTDWDNLHVANSYYRYRMWTGASRLDWQVSDDWKASVNVGYAYKRHRSNKAFVDMLNEAGDYDGYIYQFGERDETGHIQAMVQGKVSTGPIRHDLVFGASEQIYSADFGENYVYDLAFSGNIFAPQPYLVTGPIDLSTDGSPYEERQSAVFASDTMRLGEHWQAIVGLRHTYYDLEDLDGDPSEASGYTTTALTPTVALLYKPVERATIYASYVQSLESGGLVPRDAIPAYVNAGETLEATVSKQYEVGAKWDARRFQLTAAAFRIERVEPIDEYIGADRYLTQNGLSVYQGVELIGQYDVTDDLTLGLGVVHLDASIEEVEDTLILGNRPAESAEWQIVGNVEYDVPAVEGLTLHGNVRYYGDAPTDNYNTLIVPDYTLVNAGFSYDFEAGGRALTLTGNLNNVTNEKYWGLQNFGESINGSIGLKVNW